MILVVTINGILLLVVLCSRNFIIYAPVYVSANCRNAYTFKNQILTTRYTSSSAILSNDVLIFDSYSCCFGQIISCQGSVVFSSDSCHRQAVTGCRIFFSMAVLS